MADSDNIRDTLLRDAASNKHVLQVVYVYTNISYHMKFGMIDWMFIWKSESLN